MKPSEPPNSSRGCRPPRAVSDVAGPVELFEVVVLVRVVDVTGELGPVVRPGGRTPCPRRASARHPVASRFLRSAMRRTSTICRMTRRDGRDAGRACPSLPTRCTRSGRRRSSCRRRGRRVRRTSNFDSSTGLSGSVTVIERDAEEARRIGRELGVRHLAARRQPLCATPLRSRSCSSGSISSAPCCTPPVRAGRGPSGRRGASGR